MSRRQYLIELPPAVGRRVDRAAKREKRTPDDVAIAALRLYFTIPTEAPTAAELRAIRRGEAAYRKGDYVTLDEYFRTMGNRPRRTRKKVARACAVV
jgi:predicted transcriptional regulator